MCLTKLEQQKCLTLQGGAAGLGAVARDDCGVPRVADSWFCKGVLDVELGEALALLEDTSPHQIQQLRGGVTGLGAVAIDDGGVPRVAVFWFCKGVLDVKLGEALAYIFMSLIFVGVAT
ncbi:hypothetical protein ACOSP7_004440 [Xanthoceras sorbifolium]